MKYLICYSWIFNVQLHVHLKKWTLKFKLLYLRNHISHFNKIHRICCINTDIQSLKVWLKSILQWLKYSIFFSGIVFFIGTLCISSESWASVKEAILLPSRVQIILSCRISVNRPNIWSNQPRWQPRTYFFNRWCFVLTYFVFITQIKHK